MSQNNTQIQSYTETENIFSKLKKEIINTLQENAEWDKKNKIRLENRYKIKYCILFLLKFIFGILLTVGMIVVLSLIHFIEKVQLIRKLFKKVFANFLQEWRVISLKEFFFYRIGFTIHSYSTTNNN